MPPVSAPISRLLQRQAQSTIIRSLRQQRPPQQTRTILSQHCSRPTTRTGHQVRAQRPSNYTNRTHSHNNFSQQQQKQPFSSTNANANASSQHAQAQRQSQSLSQRLKDLTREYGWSALGVYLILSALDFPFCFAAVRLLGVERIGHYEHLILGEIKKLYHSVLPLERHTGEKGETESREQHAEGRHNGDEGASIWTQLALAYAIHKSLLIFIRVPLTVAVTPKVVKTLRSWGWNIGKKAPKNPPSSN